MEKPDLSNDSYLSKFFKYNEKMCPLVFDEKLASIQLKSSKYYEKPDLETCAKKCWENSECIAFDNSNTCSYYKIYDEKKDKKHGYVSPIYIQKHPKKFSDKNCYAKPKILTDESLSNENVAKIM